MNPEAIRDIWLSQDFQALITSIRGEYHKVLTSPSPRDDDEILEKRRDLVAFERMLSRIEQEAKKAG